MGPLYWIPEKLEDWSGYACIMEETSRGNTAKKTGPGIPSWNQVGARELYTVLDRFSAALTSDLMLWELQLMSGKGTCRRTGYGRKKDTRGHNYSLGQTLSVALC